MDCRHLTVVGLHYTGPYTPDSAQETGQSDSDIPPGLHCVSGSEEKLDVSVALERILESSFVMVQLINPTGQQRWYQRLGKTLNGVCIHQ